MERYEYLETISSGAYGVCYKVRDTATGQHCAAKGIKQAHEDAEVMRLTLREVKILKTLPQHVNVVKLLEAFRSHSGRIYLVFEFVERSLYQELERHPSGSLPGPMLKSVAWQLLHALGHCHDHGIMHRDIKPANVLLTGYTPGVGSGGVVKLCDFGFARSLPGGNGGGVGARAVGLSSYVMTRWYRPPEVLVGDAYSTSIDIWSYGCTLAELATGRPLFPGRSTVDQLWRIMRCLGPLPPLQSAAMRRDPRLQAVWVPPQRLRTLRQRLPDLEPRLFEVISTALTMDPRRRPTVQQLLQLPYFWDVRNMIADTDLARQLPYVAAAADMACTINFRPPPVVTAAAKPPDVSLGSFSGRTSVVLRASPPGNSQVTPAARDADMCTAALVALVIPTPPPAAAAVPSAAVSADSAAAAAPVAQSNGGTAVRSRHFPVSGTPALPQLMEQQQPPLPHHHHPQQPNAGAEARNASAYGVSYTPWSNSSNTGNVVNVTLATAAEDAITAQDPTASSPAAAAAAANAAATTGRDESVAVSKCEEGLAADQTAAVAKAATSVAAAAAVASAAAATAAAVVAAANAASAATNAAVALAHSALEAPLPPPLPAPPARPAPPPSTLLSTGPKMPFCTKAATCSAASQETAGGDGSGYSGKASTARSPAAAPNDQSNWTPCRTPAALGTPQVVSSARLFQSLPVDTEKAMPYAQIASMRASAGLLQGTGVAIAASSVTASASAAGGASGPAAAVANGGSDKGSVGGAALAFCRRSLPYDGTSGAAAVPCCRTTTAAAPSPTRAYSGGVLYLPMRDTVGGALAPSSRTLSQVVAAASPGVSAAAPGASPRQQQLTSTSRQSARMRYLRLYAAAGAAAAAAAAVSGGSVSTLAGSSGDVPASGGGAAGGTTGIALGGLSKLFRQGTRAASTNGGGSPANSAAAATTAAGNITPAAVPRIVDPEYGSISRLAGDAQNSMLASLELQYIQSPAGAPGLCQFVSSGVPLPHRRGPPIPPNFLFLSSQSDTHGTGSLYGPESEAGAALTLTTTAADVLLPSDPIPGCTFELDPYNCTADQRCTEVHDTQQHAGTSIVGGSPPHRHAPARGHSKVWSWALSSLRFVGGLDHALSHSHPKTLQRDSPQQHQPQQPQQRQQQHLIQHLNFHHIHQQQQAVAGGSAKFAHTLKWLGSHGGGSCGGGAIAQRTARSEVVELRSPFYTAATAAAPSYGAVSGIERGSCTMGSILGVSGGGGTGVGVEAAGGVSNGTDAFHGSPARAVVGLVAGYCGGGSSDAAGTTTNGNSTGSGGGGGGGGGSLHNKPVYGGSGGGAGPAGGSSIQQRSDRVKQQLNSTRSLPGWLFAARHRGAAAAADDGRGTGGDVGGGGGCTAAGAAAAVAAGGQQHRGQLVVSPSYRSMRELRRKHSVVRKSRSCMHAPVGMVKSVVPSTCLPPVEGPCWSQQMGPWVNGSVSIPAAAAAGAVGKSSVDGGGVVNLRRSPSVATPRKPNASIGAAASNGTAAAVAGAPPTRLIAIPAATAGATSAGAGAGNRTASDAGTSNPDAHATATVLGSQLRGPEPEAAAAAAAGDGRSSQHHGSSQPLYGRPYGGKAAPSASAAAAAVASSPSCSSAAAAVAAAALSAVSSAPLATQPQPQQNLPFDLCREAAAPVPQADRRISKLNNTNTNSGSSSNNSQCATRSLTTSRSGSSRLRFPSKQGALAAEAVTAAEADGARVCASSGGGCFPVGLRAILSSFRSFASRTTGPTEGASAGAGADRSGWGSGGGAGGSSLYGGSFPGGSTRGCAGGSSSGGAGSTGGGGATAASVARPPRLSTARSGLSILSEEKQCSTVSHAAAPLAAAATAAAIAVGDSGGSDAARTSGRQLSPWLYDYGGSGGGGSYGGGTGTEDDSSRKLVRGQRTVSYVGGGGCVIICGNEARHSIVPIYSRLSAGHNISGDLLACSISYGDLQQQQGSAGNGGASGGGAGGGGYCPADALLQQQSVWPTIPRQSFGPTIPEAEDDIAAAAGTGCSGASIRACASAAGAHPDAPTPSATCQPAASYTGAGTGIGGIGGGSSGVAACGAMAATPAPPAVSATTGQAAGAAKAAAGVVTASRAPQQEPGGCLSAAPPAPDCGSSNDRSLKVRWKVQQAAGGAAAGGGGSNGGGVFRRAAAEGVVGGEGEGVLGSCRNGFSGSSSRRGRSSGFRTRLRTLKLRMLELLVGVR